MSLHPPSFFSAPRLVSKPGQEQQTNEPARLQVEDELTALKKENIALKQQLSCSPGGNVQSLLVSPNPPVVLTSDLLQVEARLQSRVRLLECERIELLRELERGKLLLSEREERNVTELAEIRLVHKAAINKVQFERERLAEEQSRWREEEQQRTNTLQIQLTNSQQQHRDQVEELSAQLQQLEQANSTLTLRLEEESSGHGHMTSQLRGQLVATEAEKEALKEELDEQIRHLKDESELRDQRVNELESYLGGEIPIIKGEGPGKDVTWRDERETLLKTLHEQRSGLERLTSEHKLVNIRLSSISEILSIQEAEVTKQGPGAADDNGRVNALLTRWREKVFVLLLQQKVQQMEDSKRSTENEKERLCLLDQIVALQRERERLSHTLTDRTAELQLEISKTQCLQKELVVAHDTTDQLETQLSVYVTQASRLKTVAQEMAEQFNTHRAVFAQALTKMTGLSQRITFATSRLSSLAASLSCKMAVLHSSTRPSLPATESSCQTDSTVEPDPTDLSSFSRERLEREVVVLATERDALACQLRESTQSFQQQLTELDVASCSRLSALEGALTEARSERTLLEEQLTELRTLHYRVEEERDSLSGRVEELTTKLTGAKATLETRVETAVKKQKQESLSELTDMEALVNVARREHSKAVVQLQQLQRQLDRDKHRAVEAVELNKAKVEHELESCKKKLNTALVERNLVMTTLRQEGLALSGRQSAPAQRHCEERDSPGFTDSTPPPPTTEADHELVQNNSETVDFRTVLKDLQILSASLLEIENEQL